MLEFNPHPRRSTKKYYVKPVFLPNENDRSEYAPPVLKPALRCLCYPTRLLR